MDPTIALTRRWQIFGRSLTNHSGNSGHIFIGIGKSLKTFKRSIGSAFVELRRDD